MDLIGSVRCRVALEVDILATLATVPPCPNRLPVRSVLRTQMNTTFIKFIFIVLHYARRLTR